MSGLTTSVRVKLTDKDRLVLGKLIGLDKKGSRVKVNSYEANVILNSLITRYLKDLRSKYG